MLLLKLSIYISLCISCISVTGLQYFDVYVSETSGDFDSSNLCIYSDDVGPLSQNYSGVFATLNCTEPIYGRYLTLVRPRHRQLTLCDINVIVYDDPTVAEEAASAPLGIVFLFSFFYFFVFSCALRRKKRFIVVSLSGVCLSICGPRPPPVLPPE